MGGESVCGGDEEDIDVGEIHTSFRHLLNLCRAVSSTLMRSRIMVRYDTFMFSTCMLTLKGVNAADITKLKQNGIHTVGVRSSTSYNNSHH
jgi:hypothetical protein